MAREILKISGTDLENLHPSYREKDDFKIEIDGVFVNCHYELWLDHAPHLEFEGEISETGFRSLFFFISKETVQMSVRDFATMKARELVETYKIFYDSIREHEKEQKVQLLKESQLRLF